MTQFASKVRKTPSMLDNTVLVTATARDAGLDIDEFLARVEPILSNWDDFTALIDLKGFTAILIAKREGDLIWNTDMISSVNRDDVDTVLWDRVLGRYDNNHVDLQNDIREKEFQLFCGGFKNHSTVALSIAKKNAPIVVELARALKDGNNQHTAESTAKLSEAGHTENETKLQLMTVSNIQLPSNIKTIEINLAENQKLGLRPTKDMTGRLAIGAVASDSPILSKYPSTAFKGWVIVSINGENVVRYDYERSKSLLVDAIKSRRIKLKITI